MFFILLLLNRHVICLTLWLCWQEMEAHTDTHTKHLTTSVSASLTHIRTDTRIHSGKEE